MRTVCKGVSVDTATSTARFRAARDRLLDLRDDYDQAAAEFTFPDVGPRWNWAHDWFDEIARGNDRPGLVILDEAGERTSVSFAQMAHRSDQVAAWLRENGIGKGDVVLVMLGNQVELWDVMLGVMKVGAVILPATTALGPKD